MKLKAYSFTIISVILISNISIAQNRVFGVINIEEEGFSIDDVFIYDDNIKVLTTTNKEGFYEFITEKNKMNIIFLLVGSQYIEREIEISAETELNINFQKQSKILSEVIIKGQKIKEFQLKRLKDVEGTAIYAGK